MDWEENKGFFKGLIISGILGILISVYLVLGCSYPEIDFIWKYSFSNSAKCSLEKFWSLSTTEGVSGSAYYLTLVSLLRLVVPLIIIGGILGVLSDKKRNSS